VAILSNREALIMCWLHSTALVVSTFVVVELREGDPCKWRRQVYVRTRGEQNCVCVHACTNPCALTVSSNLQSFKRENA